MTHGDCYLLAHVGTAPREDYILRSRESEQRIEAFEAFRILD